MDKIYITKETIKKLLDYFKIEHDEEGGALVSKNNEIVDFLPLNNVEKNKSRFMFSFDELNDLLSPLFKKGYDFAGIIHSHVGGYLSPSKNDREFYSNLLATNEEYKYLFFPIISLIEGEKKIKWWVLEKDKELKEIEAQII